MRFDGQTTLDRCVYICISKRLEIGRRPIQLRFGSSSVSISMFATFYSVADLVQSGSDAAVDDFDKINLYLYLYLYLLIKEIRFLPIIFVRF
jgi:hypothetical protein